MKSFWVIILLLVLVNCNNDLKKMEGHWQIYGDPFLLSNGRYINDDSIIDIHSDIYYEPYFHFNTLDVINGKGYWNRNAIIYANKKAEINTFKKMISVQVDLQDITLSYYFKNDTLFVRDTTSNLEAYAIKTQPTISENFTTIPYKIELLKNDKDLKLIKKKGNNYFKIFISRISKRAFAENWSTVMWFYGHRVETSLFTEVYSDINKQSEIQKKGIILFIDESIFESEFKELCSQIKKTKAQKLLFAVEIIKDGNPEIAYIDFDKYTELFKAMDKERHERCNKMFNDLKVNEQ